MIRALTPTLLVLLVACASGAPPADVSPADPAEDPGAAPGRAAPDAAEPAPDTPREEGERTEFRVDPAEVTVRIGETVPWQALDVAVVDAAGRPVEGMPVQIAGGSGPFSAGSDGITGEEPGEGWILLASRGEIPEGYEAPEATRVVVRIVPPPVESVEVEMSGATPYAGTALPLDARVTAEGGLHWEGAPVTWSTDVPARATVEGGVLLLHAPGSVTVTATAEGVRGSRTLTVGANPVTDLSVSPASARLRTGDVLRLEPRATDAGGREVDDVVIEYGVQGARGAPDAGATVYDDGVFVASRPGVYRILASAGSATTRTVVEVEPRDVGMDLEPVGSGIMSALATTDLWAFRGQDGRDYVYTGTKQPGERMFAWDVTDPADPVLTDSVVVDARTVNDVKVNADATLAVITREQASDRRNGIIVLDLADPAHPTVISEYTETLTGGVHNTFIEGDLVYAVHNGTRDVHIIDISDPANPHEVGRWGIDTPGKSLHDIWIVDGLAYVSYWNDGMWIVDVGDGRWGGTPTEPVPVSSIAYPQGNTHVAFPYTNADGHSYVFVGDEIFGCEECISRSGPHIPPSPRGYIHVMDVSDIENPVEVGRYEVPEAGAHNIWVEDDRLYVAYYQAGLRVVDVSGELRGDLYLQGREIAWFPTGAEDGWIPNAPRAWGPQPYRGNIFVSDKHSGLWVLRLAPKE